MQYETLLYEIRSATARIQLNRPRRRNAINMAMVEELHACVAAVAGDNGIRAVVLVGDDVAFCAGQDLKEPEPGEFIPRLNALLFAIEDCPKPVIAAIGGWCIAGGLELALACDLRVASRNVRIGDWHARINSLGGAGAVVRLPRLIGMAAAKQLIFTGDAVDGEKAQSIGLVNEVHAPDAYEAAAFALADRIAGNNPFTVSRAKQALRDTAGLPLRAAVELSVARQASLISDLAVDLVADYQSKAKA